MAALRPRLTHKPNLPPKPKPHTPNTITAHTPAATRGDAQDTHTSSLTTTEGFHQTGHTHSSRENREKEERQKREWRTELQMDVGRSEPDGSETDESVKAEKSMKSSTAPPRHLDEKHCHCICHLPRPGMRLMWVPVEDMEDRTYAGRNVNNGSLQREDKSAGVEDTGRRRRTSIIVERTAVKSPTMPQCYSCRSFRLHHSPRDEAASEGIYESMEVFSSQPPEEPIYLQLQPSDDTSPTPPTRPIPPPRPLSTLRARQKERRSTQPVLAYVLSPRGGRPPIRPHSSCERGSGIPPLRKPKTEDQKQDGNTETKEDTESGDQEQVICDRDGGSDHAGGGDHSGEEPVQRVSPAPHRRCVSECVMRGKVTLWQNLGTVKQSGVLHTLTYRERQRQECMFEVVTSETSYLRSLNVLRDHFLGSRELDGTLVIHDKKSLFSNILQVHEVSQRFLQDLLARVDECVLISDVCDIIYHHACTHFSVYIEYVRNQLYQEKTYSKLMQCNREFHTVMRRLEQSPLCNRLPFTSFLLLPFQRITRIKILIQSILKNTLEGSKEENTACRALTTVNEIIKEANTQVGQMKQMEELIHIATMLEFDKLKAIPLVSRTRCLEKQGELQELIKGGSMFSFRFRFNPIYIFLFNDIIILTRRIVNTDRFLVLDHAHRSLVQVQRQEGGTQLDHTFCLIMLENHQGKMCERVLKANTESDLHRWTAAFPSVSMTSELKEERVYADWDCPQVQCIQQYVAKQADELSLEPSDVINVIRKTNEGWWEGIRLSDQTTGWFPHDVVIEVTNEHQRRRNLREQYRISHAANHSTASRASLQAANHSTASRASLQAANHSTASRASLQAANHSTASRASLQAANHSTANTALLHPANHSVPNSQS
ncbi:ephexin-1 isoform X2 [Pangasianodon hypophthalmus]|uniref:ephexin-1 isoform X2 n=1 Tax=Pangasianodon hypophthalmus TaxID=310915 RepID=UPI002307EA9A|nr:ephexin-1 isoform X2 [Pangasianodon hypophthalmus]